MLTNIGKRSISFLLALVMVFSMMPVQVFATEGEEIHDHDHGYEELPAEPAAVEPEAPAVIHEHVYVDTTVDASCTSGGYVNHICDCGDSYRTDEVDALGHSYEFQVIAPTTEAEGYTLHTCSVCGDSYKDNIVDKLPSEEAEHVHNYVAAETVAPTVEAEGYTVYTCDGCGDSYKDNFVEKLPAEEEPTEETLLEQLRREIAEYIETYGLTQDMPDSVLADVYVHLDSQQSYNAYFGALDMKERANGLTMEEADILLSEQNTKLVKRFYEVMEQINVPVMLAEKSTIKTPVEGVEVEIPSTVTFTENSTGNYTVSVNGNAAGACSAASENTGEVYIKNTKETEAKVTFSWEKGDDGTVVFDSDENLGSSPKSIVLPAGGELTIKLTSPASSSAVTFTMYDFKSEEVQSAYNVTFDFDSSLGSVQVDSTDVSAGETIEVSKDGATLTAVVSGSTFLGWINAVDNTILSTAASYTLKPTDEMTVKAVFAQNGGTSWFMVNNSALYDDLNVAANAETTVTNKTVVLMNNATLPAGNYTIPSGVTLLIPFDTSNSLYTSDPQYVSDQTAVKAFRTLTMEAGAKIIVQGAMSLSGKLATGQPYTAVPTGDTSFVSMQSGSEIEIQNGGKLYAWGFVTGSGAVHVLKGGTVFEPFQIAGWRGGTALLGMNNNSKRVFPLSQYFIQNIEVPLTLDAGAVEEAYVCAKVLITAGSSEPFIGSGGMFEVTSGSITKDYNEDADRLEFTIDGVVQMKNMKVSLSGYSVDSNKYELPLTNNVTVQVLNGSSITVTQNLAMLPGSQLYVEEGANIGLAKGVSIFFYDADQWNGKGYCYPANDFYSVKYAPGKKYTRSTEDLLDAYAYIEGSMDASDGFVYTTESGANITGAENASVVLTKGTASATYQATQSGTNISYATIPLTPVKLKNADGTYTETATVNGTYEYVNGVWTWHCDGNHVFIGETTRVEATCTADGSVKGNCFGCGPVETILDALDHDMAEATCTAPKTCKRGCGTTEGEALGHNYVPVVTDSTCTEKGYTTHTCTVCGDSYVDAYVDAKGHSYTSVVTDPTCTEKGYTTHTCSVCKDSYTDAEVAALGHTWGDWVQTTAPGCETKGEDRRDCGKCDAYDTREVSATGHTEGEAVKENNVDATCTEGGSYDTVVYCSVCKTELSRETITVDALGHRWVDADCDTPKTCSVCKITEGVVRPHSWSDWEVTRAATCTTDGSQQRECTHDDCDETETETITKLGHNYQAEVTSPTCTAVGYTTHTCTNCGDSYVDTYVPATGHDYEAVVTDPTCTAQGYTTNTCANCGDSYESSYVNALGHTWGDWTQTTAPGCETEGQERRDCEVCDAFETKAIQPIQHKWNEGEVTTQPGCETEGVKTFTCLNDSSHTRTEPVAATGHSYDKKTPGTEKTPATCTTAAVYFVKCDNCDHVSDTVTVSVGKELGHDFGEWITETEATCIAEGKEYRECQRDDCTAREEQKIPMEEHSLTSKVTAPTCTAKGYTTYSCKNCTLSFTDNETEMVPHTKGAAVEENRKDSDCVNEGSYDSVIYCSVCNTELSREPKVIPAKGHTEGEAVVENEIAPKCEETGSYDTVVYCSVCNTGLSRETTTVDAIGHDYDEGVVTKDPTCTEMGVKTFTCQNDSSHTYTEEVASLGHIEGDAVEENCVEPGCETAGSYDSVIYCSVCNTELSREPKEIPAKGHDWDQGVNLEGQAPTCTKDGILTYTCQTQGCGKTKTETDEKLGHDLLAETLSDATCTEPGIAAGYKCSRCDYKEDTEMIPAKGHDWDEGVVTQTPTCTEDGIRTKTCQRDGCGIKEDFTEPATGHSFTTKDSGKEATPATCTEAATHYVQCDNCTVVHETKTVSVGEAKGHSFSTKDSGEEATPATCTEAATHYVQCDNCNEIDKTKTISVGEAKGHSFTTKDSGKEATPATCTKAAIHYVQCDNCTKIHETKTVSVGEANGHKYESVVTAPTCTAAGYTTHTCSVCEDTYTSDPVVATGHDYKTVTTQPTCTEDGYSTHTCSVCGNVSITKGAAATGHKAAEAVEENRSEADCTTAGSYESVIYCSKCGEEQSREDKVIPALGHTEGVAVTENDVPPTCENAGSYDTVVYCSVCNAELSRNTTTVDALGHTEGEAKVENNVAPTCENAGSYDTVVCCSVCGDELSRENTVVEAIGHEWDAGKVTTRPDCDTAGVTTYTCKNDKSHTKTEPIAALGHKPMSAVKENPVDADCEKDGSYDTVVYCSVCGDELSRETTVLPAIGHDWNEGAITTNPSCTEAGVKTYTCKNDRKHTKTEEVAATGHSAGEAVTENTVNPTCTEDGSFDTVVYCSVKNCSAELSRNTTTVTAIGHDYDDGVVTTDPTCTEKGVRTFTCQNDGTHTYTEEVAATGHTEGEAVTENNIAPTCEDAGSYDTVVYCSACGDELSRETTTVKAVGHGWDAGKITTEPKCEAEGVMTYTCQHDNSHTYTEVVEATGHSEITHEAKAPTCEAVGWDAYVTCENCDYTTYQEKAALGHDMADATCQAPASCQNEGCTYTEGEPLEHVAVQDDEEPAMCEVPGRTAGSHCAVCNETLSGREEIPALEHKMVSYAAKRPTYTGVGWDAYEACELCGNSTKVEIPKLDEPVIEEYETFMTNLMLLEEVADVYVQQNPGKDPAALVIKFIRTGVERYNSGSWGIMAGYEDTAFAEFVYAMEDQYNSAVEDESQMLMISGLKNLENFNLPNGDLADIGHVFGMMDITYHNNFSVNHADVAGWAGDTVDLLSLSDQFGVSGMLDEMVADISENYLLKNEFPEKPIEGSFNLTDMQGDMDGYYIMNQLKAQGYEKGTLTEILRNYFTEEMNDVTRADYFLKNRLGGVTLRSEIRDAVYNAYSGNSVVGTLEATREFTSSDLATMKKACCYAVADYLCRLAGDFVDVTENSYFTVFSSESSTLAPGITQDIKMATSADNKQMVYYIATADINRDDVQVYANYNNNDPGAGWAMQRVLDQANVAQNKYGNPESEHYIENYNVIVSTNGAGFAMTTDGEPGGLLVMGGVEYHPIDGNGFFGILKDGRAVIGTTQEYNTIYKGQVQEGIAGFGSTLVKDGKISVSASSNYYNNRASRTAVGITKTGKVVLMVLDGRQEPWSCGGSMEEIAQIMLEAGCVEAINLDGGGSTTFVARQEGADALEVVNRPSDGFQRSVGATLMITSTAPSSTAFDHAIIDSATDYMTIGSSQRMTAEGVSATGNAAEIPEGAVWAVSNDRWATITEDGVLTALRNGDVDVNLMVDEQIIGTKTMHIVVPNNLYFTKSKLDVVYGETVDLPIKLLYNGKNVTAHSGDVVFSLDVENAGTFDGFTFTASEESMIRAAKVTATLAGNKAITANISLALYNQGEASFNFEKATGGDRQLAWDRKVSNTTTEDAITYSVVNPDEDMVTSYIFAIDMTQIPIPPVLSDLVHMLPGSDVEGASAWGFLLQLAQRVSVLTEVRPVLRFDPNFEVDYTNLTLVNEYFDLKTVEFDETTNSLTMYLKWKKQTQAIDPNEANPMCIVSGIKLTPKKDAAWSSKDTLTAVHSGEVGYDIYLRASSLYSFAQKPENQVAYGLTPYVNPEDSSDAGAGFGDIYKDFEDTYTLVRVLKNGWINEEGGFAYYVNGVKHTGIQNVDGYYYDFGEKGINVGQTKYTGMLTLDGKTCYCQLGKLVSGWYAIGSDYYYFDPVTFAAHTGESTIDKMIYTFDEAGKLVRGAFVETASGTNYYWAGRKKTREWIDLEEGRRYVDDDGYVAFGSWLVKQNATEATVWWNFDEETGIVIGLADGFITHRGQEYYCENGKWFYGAVAVEDGIIFSGTNGRVTKNAKCYVAEGLETTADLETGYYWCDEKGRIVGNGFVTIDDSTYYFGDYVRAKGFTKIGDDFYFFNAGNGKMYKSTTLWVNGNNPYNVPGGYHEFLEDGRMYVFNPNGFQAIVEEDGKLYYTIDGVKQRNGLYELDGEYYYAKNDCVLAVDETVWVSEDHGLLTENYGYYAFSSDAKMIKTGFVTGGGATYYYKDLVRLKGFIQIGFDYYFLNAGSGKMYRDTTLWVGANDYGIANGMYYFRADGTMFDPAHEVDGKKVVKVDDSWYFLIDGVAMKSGLYELMGEYYYAFADGTLAAGSTIWIQEKYDQLPSGSGFYGFTEDAKLVRNGFIESADGSNYYYSDAVRAKGLTKIGDDYYFFNAGSGKLYKGVTLWVGSNNYGLEGGYYDFQEDGRMYVPAFDITTGIVEKNGNLYYVVDGIMQTNGLVEVDGEYYYAQPSGVLSRNQTIWVSQKNGLIPAKGDYYAFDSDGKLIKTGFVTGGGYTYYYDNLNMALGFTKIGTDYYIFNAGSGKMYKDANMWVGANNYGFAAGFYYFYPDGKMDNPNPDPDPTPDPTPDPEPDDTIKVTGIVEENGKLYYLIDNVKQTNGLVEVDGEYYYAQSSGVLSRNQTIWVSQKNGLIPAKGDYYAFDSDGKLIKTGFVTGGGYTYYYDNLNMALGFTKIGDAYYFFNAGSGKMYRDVSLWVGNNAYGIEGGFHYFRPDGTMEQG